MGVIIFDEHDNKKEPKKDRKDSKLKEDQQWSLKDIWYPLGKPQVRP